MSEDRDEILLAVKQQLTLIIKSWKRVTYSHENGLSQFRIDERKFVVFDNDLLILPLFELQTRLIEQLLGYIVEGNHPEMGPSQEISLLQADFTSYIPLIEQSYHVAVIADL